MMARVGAIDEGLLREVVGAPEARLGIPPHELRVRKGGQEREDQRDRDAGPDVGRDRASVGRRRGGLELVRDPEERARRDEGHGVDRDAGQSERGLHLPSSRLSSHRSSSPATAGGFGLSTANAREQGPYRKEPAE